MTSDVGKVRATTVSGMSGRCIALLIPGTESGYCLEQVVCAERSATVTVPLDVVGLARGHEARPPGVTRQPRSVRGPRPAGGGLLLVAERREEVRGRCAEAGDVVPARVGGLRGGA